MSDMEKINLLHYHIPNFSKQTIFDGEELSMLELAAKVAQKLNEALDALNEGLASIEGKEDSKNITNNRKLSPTGNFTGTIFGKGGLSIIQELDSNLDKIQYLADQFSDGLNGLVVDGGFFLDTNIERNYDGGVF